MTKQSLKQPRRFDLDLMRGLAIVAVVVIHCIAPVVLLREVGSTSWMIGNIIDSASRWAVPLFIMISGGLLIKRAAYLNIGEFYKKRLRRLTLPLVAWPIIYYLWCISTIRPAGLFDFFHAYVLGTPLGGYQLYFLFIIAGLYVIAPMLSAFVSVVQKRHVWIICITILATTTLSFHLSQFLRIPVSYNAFTLFFPYVGYFLLGHLLINLKTRVPLKILFSGLMIITTTIVISTLSYFSMQSTGKLPFYDYASLPVILLSISVFLFIQGISDSLSTMSDSIINVVKSLSYNSLGIYLIHVIFLESAIQLLKFDKASITKALLLMPSTLLLSWITVIILRRVYVARRFVE
jgi:surface polysaccharide O-acyltransferase-like enzyme